MESLGTKLKNTREEKALTIRQISLETNISSRYLEALEQENFDVFPSEPYIIGFLKNYSDYLGLEQESILSLYRSQKIQDQPIPMDELLREPSRLPKVLSVIGIVVVVLIILTAGAYLLLNNFPQAETVPIIAERLPSEYLLTGNLLERRLYPGDSVLVYGENDQYRLFFTGIGDTVSLSTPRGLVMLDLGQEQTVDISESDFVRLRIIATDFVRNDNVFGAQLRFEQERLPQPQLIEEEPLYIPLEASIPRDRATVILTSPNAMPFILQAHFQNYCFFRYEILFEPNRAGRNEQYFQRSQEISINAQNGIRLGISNAQAVRMQVIVSGRTYQVETGGAGEVVAADLRWLRDEDNRFSLVLLKLE